MLDLYIRLPLLFQLWLNCTAEGWYWRFFALAFSRLLEFGQDCSVRSGFYFFFILLKFAEDFSSFYGFARICSRLIPFPDFTLSFSVR
jgi:hypothetical protein